VDALVLDCPKTLPLGPFELPLGSLLVKAAG
jgi:hypothetical protein